MPGPATMAADQRYSAVAVLLHWATAFAILANIALGWNMVRLTGLAEFRLFQLHKSIGISVLGLSVLRLGWRLINRPPPYAQALSPAEHRLAVIVHWTLYVLMVLIPITGWIIVSASLYNLPTLLFGTVPWPHLGPIHDLPVASRKLIEARGGVVHAWLAWTLLGLAVLHMLAALKHHFIGHDDVLARMLPGLRARKSIREI